MDGPMEDRFRQEVRENLSRIEDALVAVLGQLANFTYPDEIAAIDFEVLGDAFSSQFPARAFFLDKSNCEYFVEVDGKATYPSPVDPELLHITGIYSQEFEDECIADAPDLDPWSIATEEFILWFHLCWGKAGGSSLKLAATLAHHDSSREFNLQSGQWQARGTAFRA